MINIYIRVSDLRYVGDLEFDLLEVSHKSGSTNDTLLSGSLSLRWV